MWMAQWELPSELEEQALHWRQSRLEEHGFPDWEEALSVYAPPEGVQSHPRPPAPPYARGGGWVFVVAGSPGTDTPESASLSTADRGDRWPAASSGTHSVHHRVAGGDSSL